MEGKPTATEKRISYVSNTISKVASDIKALAIKKDLNQDELIELIIAFVQSIPYDDEKLQIIETSPEDLTEDVIDQAITSLPEYP